ncbi:MAG TPA: ABC transporter permease, partial [Verrucomicrobiae bacterium]
MQELNDPLEVAEPAAAKPRAAELPSPSVPWRFLLALPLAALAALGVHAWASHKQLPPESQPYFVLLVSVLVLSMLAAACQPFSAWLRKRMPHFCPLFAAALVLLAIWESVTSGLRWLPMPYFPSPAGVLRSLIDDRELLWDSTWHSLVLLLSGYALGVIVALVTGICIGWFGRARYWGMPLLKILGPIPATAWIPLAMVVSPKASFSAV